ncbi:MAG: hypothetical protein EOO77_18285 [Oxalobacteraceae bacterium]|nr:MAG: hypothetical protein EOO77_18285 [Oxalobacteraceae bacterium]
MNSTDGKTLIESVTIYPEGPHGPEAEVMAKVSDLMAFATNDNAAPRGGMSSSMVVVAGTCSHLGLLTSSKWSTQQAR